MLLPSITGLFQNTEIQCKIKALILQVVDSRSIPSNTESPNTLILFHFYLISRKSSPYFISELYFSNSCLQFSLPNCMFGPRSSKIYLPLLVILLIQSTYYIVSPSVSQSGSNQHYNQVVDAIHLTRVL